MSFFSRMREKHKGIKVKSSGYFEMCYLKNKKRYYLCFTSIDLIQAQLKTQIYKKKYEASKIVYLKQLNSKNLAASLTWNNKDWNK